MIFWSIVGIVILVVLFAAWRKDHKRRVTISRTNGEVERGIGETWGYYH